MAEHVIRDVFLRELISNANDALEKLRLTSLTEPEALSGAESLNITIKSIKDDDGSGRLIITGMLARIPAYMPSNSFFKTPGLV